MDHPKEISLHVVVTGRVQGVCYRDWTRQRAMSLGVHGWVRNRPDGSVEAVFKGPVDKVNTLVRDCHEGPPLANVVSVETKPDPYDGPADFLVEPRLV